MNNFNSHLLKQIVLLDSPKGRKRNIYLKNKNSLVDQKELCEITDYLS